MGSGMDLAHELEELEWEVERKLQGWTKAQIDIFFEMEAKKRNSRLPKSIKHEHCKGCDHRDKMIELLQNRIKELE